MNNFQYKLAQFFRGRRGTDEFNLFLLIASLALQLLGGLFNIWLIMIIGQVAILFCIFRTLSKNLYQREKENQSFLRVWNKFSKKNRSGNYKNNQYGGYTNNSYNSGYNEQSKKKKNNPNSAIQYCYYNCPQCKQQIRVPAGNGKVKVTCPSCKSKFELNT